MEEPTQLKFHERIGVKILLGITLLILVVEAVLLVFSVSSRGRELRMYRQEAAGVVSELTGKAISVESILPDAEIGKRLNTYIRHIVLMVVLILVVVVSGSYFIVSKILIRPILTIYRDNLRIAENPETDAAIRVADFPRSEIGLIMASRREMLESLDRAQRQILDAKQKLEKQNEVLRENARLREDIERITRHDLKSPLNGIINYPNLVLAEGRLSEKQEKFLKKTSRLGHRMLNMINLSLDLYKMEKGTYQVFPMSSDVLPVLANILQEERHVIASKKLDVKIRINGRLACETDRFEVPGEKLLFYSMLANLIKNALEASPRKETVVISLKDKEEIVLEVRNPGEVPEDIRDTFFEKYSTFGKVGGTGLGTYSAKLITETMGGRIELDAAGAGKTTVRVTFPGKAGSADYAD